jgi:hypothetical protein
LRDSRNSTPVASLTNPGAYCPDLETDPFDSLKFFLMGYAFERQGRSSDYAPAARDTAEELKKYPLTRGSEVLEFLRQSHGRALREVMDAEIDISDVVQ